MLFLLTFAPTAIQAQSEKAVSDSEQVKSVPTYIQLQFGFASDADFGPSLLFLVDQSPEKTLLHSVSIGRRFSDSFLGREADVVGFIGMQNYLERDYQPDSYGLTIYWKVYRALNLPGFPAYLPVRFGLGQGLSYASRIPVAEQRDFLPQQSAEMVHYLEWSVQVPVSGLLRLLRLPASASLDRLWLGYNIFHRSTVFGLFADSAGGINYPGIAVEYRLE